MASRPWLLRPSREFPIRHEEWVRTADQPRSTGFRAGGCSRDVTAPVPRVYLPVSLTAPGHPAVLNRRDFVEAAPALPTDPWLRLPPASPRRCDSEEMDGLSPPSGNSSASWRTSRPSTL